MIFDCNSILKMWTERRRYYKIAYMTLNLSLQFCEFVDGTNRSL